MQNIKPIAANYDVFAETVRKVSRRWIPRGCRQQYIPGLSTDSKTLYTYTKLYEEDPFSEETLQQVNQSINIRIFQAWQNAGQQDTIISLIIQNSKIVEWTKM